MLVELIYRFALVLIIILTSSDWSMLGIRCVFFQVRLFLQRNIYIKNIDVLFYLFFKYPFSAQGFLNCTEIAYLLWHVAHIGNQRRQYESPGLLDDALRQIIKMWASQKLAC